MYLSILRFIEHKQQDDIRVENRHSTNDYIKEKYNRALLELED